jgi:hypothetical protein
MEAAETAIREPLLDVELRRDCRMARQETTITLIIALIIREHAADENGITR